MVAAGLRMTIPAARRPPAVHTRGPLCTLRHTHPRSTFSVPYARHMSKARWTLGTLKALMDERDTRYQQRYDAQQKALDAALLAAKEAVQAALLAAKEAVLKAELSADKRLELLNELRTGVATTEQLEALDKVVTSLSKRLDLTEGRSMGRGATWGYLVAGISLLTAVLAFLLR